jgi:NADPH:quinone reductase-like Zn-dependent oxidoreductase
MKAVSLRAFGASDNFIETDAPIVAPKEGEVQVQILASSFNPIDVAFRRGELGGTPPLILGRDFSGLVTQIGPDVADLQVGDAVYGYLPGPRSNGTYAEYVTAPAVFMAEKPETLSFEQAAGVPVVGMTALHAIRKAGIQTGETVFVAGAAGGVGTAAIRMLRRSGAGRVVVTAGSDASAAYLVEELGIPETDVVRYDNLPPAGLKTQTLDANGGGAFDATFDFVGGRMKRLCFEVVGVDGRVVSIVEKPADFDFNLWDERTSPLVLKSASFHFVQLGARAYLGEPGSWMAYRRELDELAKLIDSGTFRALKVTVVGPLSVASVRVAHSALEVGRNQGKLMMNHGLPIA